MTQPSDRSYDPYAPQAEIVGPFNHRDLVVHGYTVPGIEAVEQDGGRICFSIDRRIIWTCSAADFEQVACLVADAYALGLGLASAPRADEHAEDWVDALKRVPALMRPRRTHEITAVSTDEADDE